MSIADQASILVTHQQTRFLIADNDQSKEIDIRDLDIAIEQKLDRGGHPASRVKTAKSRGDAHEILAHAHLRIKRGVHYCFVGRNGVGKTTLLQSISHKLIPGLDPLNIRMAALEQRNDVKYTPPSVSNTASTVLDYVTNSDPYRRELQRKHDILAEASASTSAADLVNAYRRLQLEEEMHELGMLEKEAKLRSGARGFNARAELRKHETRVQDAIAALKNTALDSSESHAFEQHARQATQLLADVQSQLETMPLRELELKAAGILSGLGFSDTMQRQSFHKLSGGWQMRALLAATLVQPADLVLLDEPSNHLDMLGILWLQKHLVELKDTAPDRSVILVSHDRQFVNAICEELIILTNKQLIYYPGNLDSYDKSIYRERLRLTRMKEAQDKQVAHIKSSIAESMRQGKKHNDDGKLKQAKSRQKKLDDRMGMEVSAKGTRFKLNRDLAGYHLTSRAGIEVPHAEAAISMSFPAPSPIYPAGSLVSLEHVSLKFKSASKPVLSDVNLVIHPGDRIGVLGLNGAGKSTLVKVLTGTLPTTSGSVQAHPRLKTGYYSQLAVDVLRQQGKEDAQLTSLSLFMVKAHDKGIDMPEQPARALLSSLGLQGRTASDTPIAKLSGGQLVRLALALLLVDPPQLLVLDEPSTHLDVYAVTALAKALQAYDGAVVLVTHDRFMMKVIVQNESVDDYDDSDDEADSDQSEEDTRRRLVYVVGSGKVVSCVGGVDAWETSLEKKLSQ